MYFIVPGFDDIIINGGAEGFSNKSAHEIDQIATTLFFTKMVAKYDLYLIISKQVALNNFTCKLFTFDKPDND
jgi:hypothetical protein